MYVYCIHIQNIDIITTPIQSLKRGLDVGLYVFKTDLNRNESCPNSFHYFPD